MLPPLLPPSTGADWRPIVGSAGAEIVPIVIDSVGMTSNSLGYDANFAAVTSNW